MMSSTTPTVTWSPHPPTTQPLPHLLSVRDLVHIDAAGEEVPLMPALPMMDDDDDALPGVEERKTGRTPNVNATSL